MSFLWMQSHVSYSGHRLVLRACLGLALLVPVLWASCAPTTWGPIAGEKNNCDPWSSPNHTDLAGALKAREGTQNTADEWSAFEPKDRATGCLVVSRTPTGGEAGATEYKLVQLTDAGEIYPWNVEVSAFENKPVKLRNLNKEATYRFQFFAFRHPVKRLARDQGISSDPNVLPETLMTLIEADFCRELEEKSYKDALGGKESWALFVLEFQPSGGGEKTKLADFSQATTSIERYPRDTSDNTLCALYKNRSGGPVTPTETAPELQPDATELIPELPPEPPKPEPPPEPADTRPEFPPEPPKPELPPEPPPETTPEPPKPGNCFPGCSFVNRTHPPKTISSFRGTSLAGSPQGDYFSTCDGKLCKLFQYDANKKAYTERSGTFPSGRGGILVGSDWAPNHNYVLHLNNTKLTAWEVKPSTSRQFFTATEGSVTFLYAKFNHDAKRLYAIGRGTQAFVWKFSQPGTSSPTKVSLGAISLITPSGFAVHPTKNMFAVGVKDIVQGQANSTWHVNLYEEDRQGNYKATKIPLSKTSSTTKVLALAFDPRGDQLVVSAETSPASFFTIGIPAKFGPQGQYIGKLITNQDKSFASPMHTVAFSRNGELMITSEGPPNNHTVKLWQRNPHTTGTPYLDSGFFPNGISAAPASWRAFAFGTSCRDVISLSNATDSLQLWPCRQ